MDNLEIYRELVEQHDMMYRYSGDLDLYRAGLSQFAEIVKLAKLVPVDDARSIWDDKVSRSVSWKHAVSFSFDTLILPLFGNRF